MKKYRGLGVSEGIAIGNAYIYTNEDLDLSSYEETGLCFEEKKNIVDKAFQKAKDELSELYENLKDIAEKEAEIITAQLLMLEDPELIEAVYKFLKKGFTTPLSVKKAFEVYISLMEKLNNKYLKERIKDIEDVEDRILRAILNKPRRGLSLLSSPVIVFTKDLSPSDTAGIDRKNVLGIVTEEGGRTSHTAILSEALGIPAVLGIPKITDEIKDGELVIIDGKNGEIIVSPDEETVKVYKEKISARKREEKGAFEKRFQPAITKRGRHIEISANIGGLEDVDSALSMGADSIGLFRTEFLFLEREEPPTEEEQFEIYKEIVEKFGEKGVVVRTLDIGGDKQVPYIRHLKEEQNPFLGIRGIRLSLIEKDLFKTQLRAILRASAYGKVRIMYPMVATKEEIIKANSILEEAKNKLKEERIPFDPEIEVGIMIEIPAAALNTEELIVYADFFSIGTNDLIQYTFAADRTNNALDYLYLPTHPAILKLIEITVNASHQKGKWTGVCGEIAGDPDVVPYLVKLGVDELSMSPQKIPRIKGIVRELT